MNVSRRMSFVLLAFAVAMAGLSSGVHGQQKEKGAGDATGTWKSTLNTPNGDTIEMTYKLKQEGEKLTGTSQRGDGPERKIEKGEVRAGKVSFQYDVEFNGNKFTVKYSGELKGDTIKGKVEVGDNSLDWEAKRQKDKGKGK